MYNAELIASTLFKPLMLFLPYLLILGLLAYLLRSPWLKGKIGEYWVNRLAEQRLDKEVYHLVRNVTLPTTDGTTQIDHILVSIYGLFVIETKNMRGWIFGQAQQAKWTQQIYRHRSQFQNPLRQNYKHTQTLKDLLDLDDRQVFSVISFIGEARFKTPMPANVTRGSGYIDYIRAQTAPVLTQEQVHQILDRLEQRRLAPSLQTDRQHVAHLRATQSAKAVPPRQLEGAPACPRCGAIMVRRAVKKGPNAGQAFWGCSQYPRCRGMQHLDD